MRNKRLQLGAPAIIVIVIGIFLIFWLITSAIIRGRTVTGPIAVPAAQNIVDTKIVAAGIPIVQVELEESVSVFLANFYAAYADADAERMATYFTVDRQPEDLATYQSLFLGKSEERLFVASNAQERVSGHEVISAEAESAGWKIIVTEQRSNANGDDIVIVTTELKLIPAPTGAGNWLIASYMRQGASGTYEALKSL